MLSLDSIFVPQFHRRILTLFLTRTINDPTFIPMIRLDEIRHITQEPLPFVFDDVPQVGSVETLREDQRFVHREVRHHVGFDSWIRGGGECDQGNVRVVSFERSHLLVIGTCVKTLSLSVRAMKRRADKESRVLTEIVTPGTNTMSFIENETSQLTFPIQI